MIKNPWAEAKRLRDELLYVQNSLDVCRAEFVDQAKLLEDVTNESVELEEQKSELSVENDRLEVELQKYKRWHERFKEDMMRIGLQTHNCLKATSEPVNQNVAIGSEATRRKDETT